VLSFSVALLLTLLHPIHELHENHAIYLSVAEVAPNSESRNASIKIKVFINDIEDALFNAFDQRINLSDNSSCASNEASVEAYFSKHFLFSVNGKKAELSLTGCEINGDAIWFYFEADCDVQWKTINIMANYLMELFPTQSNVVSIINGEDKRFIRLTKSKSNETVKF